MSMNLFANLNVTSYGYTASYLFRELMRAKIDVRFFPISQVEPEQKFIEELGPFLNTEKLINDGPCLKIWHQHDLATFIGKGARIGMPIFELDTFTEREKNHIENCDKIIVCSEWAKSVVLSQTAQQNVEVVPLGYDPVTFPNKPVRNDGPFVFGNFGKWEIRKGHDILKEAFNTAFTLDDDVELWLAPHNQFLSEYQQRTWENFYKNSSMGPKIKIVQRLPTQDHVAEVMSQIDCGVFPARAEGWNLEALECLGVGRHVIATDYSGHTQYLREDNAYLISCPERETAYDGVFFNGQGKWAKFTKPMFQQLVEYMRQVYKEGRSFNSNGLDTAKQFTWEKAGKRLIEVL